MEIIFTHLFKKNFKKRIKPKISLKKKFYRRVELFITNPQNAILQDHQLIGRLKKYRAFSITGDIRLIYQIKSKSTVLFINIGTHNRIYG